MKRVRYFGVSPDGGTATSTRWPFGSTNATSHVPPSASAYRWSVESKRSGRRSMRLTSPWSVPRADATSACVFQRNTFGAFAWARNAHGNGTRRGRASLSEFRRCAAHEGWPFVR
jgi:hypothetical protein